MKKSEIRNPSPRKEIKDFQQGKQIQNSNVQNSKGIPSPPQSSPFPLGKRRIGKRREEGGELDEMFFPRGKGEIEKRKGGVLEKYFSRGKGEGFFFSSLPSFSSTLLKNNVGFPVIF